MNILIKTRWWLLQLLTSSRWLVQVLPPELSCVDDYNPREAAEMLILGDSWCFAGQTMDISDQRCNHQQTLSAHSAHSSSELLSENIEFKMILTLSTSFYLTTKLGKMDLFTIELNLVFEWSVKNKTDPPDVHPDHVSVVASKIHQKHLVANNVSIGNTTSYDTTTQAFTG